jgi:hypothetical protein
MVCKTLTVSVCRRPEYTRRTLEALAACDGIGEYRVGIFVDHQCDETLRVAREIAVSAGWQMKMSAAPLGCNKAIGESLLWGFADMGSLYHIHLEDDTVPAPDCLRWFEWAKQFGINPNVFTVSAYSRDTDGAAYQARARQWFTPWGWATWSNRFSEYQSQWAKAEDPSWDIFVNHKFRGSRFEVYPALAQTKNIGAENGTHTTPEQWDAEQRNDRWAGATGDRVSEWRASWLQPA